MFDSNLLRHGREFLRAFNQHKFEITPEGVYFPEQHGLVGGSLIHTLNGADRCVDHNTFTIEGLNYLLNVGLKGATQASAFYLAPFSGNVTPATSLTAATFTATQTEITDYTSSTRVEYVEGTVASGSVSNSASRAEVTANASITVWGAGLLSISTKSSTSGTLLAAAKFASSRAMVDTDVLAFEYSLTLTPA